MGGGAAAVIKEVPHAHVDQTMMILYPLNRPSFELTLHTIIETGTIQIHLMRKGMSEARTSHPISNSQFFRLIKTSSTSSKKRAQPIPTANTRCALFFRLIKTSSTSS